MNPEPASDYARLFHNILSCELSAPCKLDTGAGTSIDGAEMRLRAISLVEDARSEDSEERQDKTSALQRIEAKLDLVLAMCGQMLRNRFENLEERCFRLSSRGLMLPLDSSTTPPQAGSNLIFRFQAAEWLPDPVSLPVVALSCESVAGIPHLLLKIDPQSSALQELLERHIFRVHRRQIAHQRQKHR